MEELDFDNSHKLLQIVKHRPLLEDFRLSDHESFLQNCDDPHLSLILSPLSSLSSSHFSLLPVIVGSVKKRQTAITPNGNTHTKGQRHPQSSKSLSLIKYHFIGNNTKEKAAKSELLSLWFPYWKELSINFSVFTLSRIGSSLINYHPRALK